MESSSSSFVSKARIAFHSAAAKAEKVLTDIKSDLKHDRDYSKQLADDLKNLSKSDSHDNEIESKRKNDSKRRPTPIVTKQDWQDRLKSFGKGKKGVHDIENTVDSNSTMSFTFFDENMYEKTPRGDSRSKVFDMDFPTECSTSTAMEIPSTSILKQLAIAVEAGKMYKSMKDFLASSRDSSPVRERAGLSLSAVKSLVLREKEEKGTSELGDDEKFFSLIHSLLDSEGDIPRRTTGYCSETPIATLSMHRDIHGAPPKSFIVKLSEVVGSFKTLRKMALFWCKIVEELRRLWYEEQHIPGIPLDDTPDLNSCLLYQKMQVINCCVSRKRRRVIATESLDLLTRETSSEIEKLITSTGMLPASHILYAKIGPGKHILRLGADHPSDNLTMLETGEPVYSPVTQEGALLTEDLIRETEEFVLRTGSMGAGCSQLLSDMQAFKAANPGCILEDFVRWYSPPDWMITELGESADSDDLLSTRGQLSSRMQKEGNLWRELWETSKPVPAARQAPLFDEDLAVDGIMTFLEDITPSELFEQLFVSLLGLGFSLAEATLGTNRELSKLFYECKDYIVAICQSPSWNEKVDDLCQVYDTVQTMLSNPDEVLKIIKQPEGTASGTDELKGRFKRPSLYFGGKDKNFKNAEESQTRQSFTKFFDGRSSLFSKKPPKPDSASPVDKLSFTDGNDWTII